MEALAAYAQHVPFLHLQEGAARIEGDARVLTPAALTFTADDANLIAVGGKDSSVLQWSVSRL